MATPAQRFGAATRTRTRTSEARKKNAAVTR
jgi:hypothetical protein